MLKWMRFNTGLSLDNAVALQCLKTQGILQRLQESITVVASNTDVNPWGAEGYCRSLRVCEIEAAVTTQLCTMLANPTTALPREDSCISGSCSPWDFVVLYKSIGVMV